MSLITGSPGNIYGLRGLDSIRGDIPKDRYQGKSFYTIMNDIKKIQKHEMRSKNYTRVSEESQEELVYGLNMSVPIKMTNQEKTDDRLLRRHLVKSSTNKLADNIKLYESQKKEK